MALPVIERDEGGREGGTEERGKDEGVGQSAGMDEESLLSRIRQNKRRGYNGNESNSGGYKKKKNFLGGGGAPRCAVRSKLPGINLEETASRMEDGGGREGAVAGAHKAPTHLHESVA